jgi:hypothetical protein
MAVSLERPRTVKCLCPPDVPSLTVLRSSRLDTSGSFGRKTSRGALTGDAAEKIGMSEAIGAVVVQPSRPHLGFGMERIGCPFPVRDFTLELARGSVV